MQMLQACHLSKLLHPYQMLSLRKASLISKTIENMAIAICIKMSETLQ